MAQQKFYPIPVSKPQASSTQEEVCEAIMTSPKGRDMSQITLFSKGCDALYLKKSIRKVFFAQPKGKTGYCLWRVQFQLLDAVESEKCLVDEIIKIIKSLIRSLKDYSFPIEEYRAKGACPEHSYTLFSPKSFLK